jgi:hypothetical protein
MAWPTSDDLLDFLKAARLVATTPTAWQELLDVDTALESAIEEFEARVGYRPFLAGEDATARKFTPEGLSILDLDGGATSVETVALDGETLEEDKDYWLMPANAPAEGKPFTYIEFDEPLFGKRNSLVITALWGYAAAVPAKAKTTVLAGAAGLLSPQLASGIANGLIRLTQGDQTEEWGSKPLESITAGWQSQFEGGVKHYKRFQMA